MIHTTMTVLAQYIRNLMILLDKNTLVSKQYEYWFSLVLRLMLQIGIEIYQQLAVDCERLTRVLVHTQC